MTISPRPFRCVVMVAACAIGVSACGSEAAEQSPAASTTGGSTAASAPDATTGATTAPPTATTEPVSPIDLPSTSVQDLAIGALAEELGIDSTDITVVSSDSVTWPNSALGCPKPGIQYLQVLSEGAQVVLSVDGTEYDYHAGQDGIPFLCEGGIGNLPRPMPTTSTDG